MRFPWPLAVAAVVALSGCTAPSSGDDVESRLAAQQAELSAEALRSLSDRSCPDLPERDRLAGLPATRLACLGEGEPRALDAGDGRPTVVNLWASWCAPCHLEHPVLMGLKAKGVRMFGLNYKDDPENARRFLGGLGNPFVKLGADPAGRGAIEWGVYGVPETFVVTGDGRIAYQLGADLRVFDIAAGTDTRVEASLVSDFDQQRTRRVRSPLDALTSIDVANKAQRIVLTARGKVTIAGDLRGGVTSRQDLPDARHPSH